MAVVLESYGKLNLFLEVLGKTAGGDHEIVTVMQSISITDTIALEESDSIAVTAGAPDVPDGEENIAHRAARLLRQELGERRGCTIRIRKGIPAQAGLGGGSGNGAAVLAGLCRLWGREVPVARLEAIGAKLGADVPFFLHGGTRLCEGRGDLLRPWPPIPPSTRFLVVTPDLRLATSLVYQEFDTLALTGGGRSSNLKRVPGTGTDPGEMLLRLFNRLEEAVLPTYPSIREIKGRMRRFCPAGVFMSGSGPSLFGVVGDAAAAREALSLFSDCRHATVAQPTHSGYRILPETDMSLSTEGGEPNGD